MTPDYCQKTPGCRFIPDHFGTCEVLIISSRVDPEVERLRAVVARVEALRTMWRRRHGFLIGEGYSYPAEKCAEYLGELERALAPTEPEKETP